MLYGNQFNLSRTHLRRWIAAYNQGGIRALEHPQANMTVKRKTPLSSTNPTTKKHRQS
ncbi:MULTISPECIES: helix-turn-helix domain-containing protein [unclassified Neisseria]|uniref:helix-turn-helix domain-containing protein n=1 Tax=unclassified Neisseria TaxID=2623750 RepID=UPI00266648E7|nr:MULTISPECIES: helix-turn-helix domain-containing protein [unclassified Neisseria]MDO1510154.1 helix-turn-helix domain-containing protein [Neisseria sp. MVDL19-042950]MDO1516730.1 helix-turn-helix domain-containing protein [Neisseria sp. MVDL18-041461]MDO1563877.1 helix-turn-helix domain-containing protein [Neisseria sp. MVDL20-010259]